MISKASSGPKIRTKWEKQNNSNKYMGSGCIQRQGKRILQWKQSELEDVDRNSRKTLTMYGALHPKSDKDRLYIKRKEGGRGLMSVKHFVKEEQRSLGFYVASSEENFIRGVPAAETINTEDTVTSGEF